MFAFVIQTDGRTDEADGSGGGEIHWRMAAQANKAFLSGVRTPEHSVQTESADWRRMDFGWMGNWGWHLRRAKGRKYCVGGDNPIYGPGWMDDEQTKKGKNGPRNASGEAARRRRQ